MRDTEAGWRERVARPLRRPFPRLTAAALAGAALSLTLPPFDILPAIAAYSVLAALGAVVDDGAALGVRLRRRALLGAAFGFGYHLAGLWWIGAAFLVDADRYAVLLPLAVVGLPLLLAPFHALAVALAGLAPPGFASRTVSLAGTLALTEWMRGILFTGFPWNVPAVQLSSSLPLAQGVAVAGVAGLAPLAVMLGSVPALLLARRVVSAGLILVLTAGVWVYGAARLTDEAVPMEGGRLRLVQPSIPQREKWEPEARARIWATLLGLTEAPGEDGTRPDLVIWPETAMPFVYRTPSAAQYDIAGALGPGRTLVAGAITLEQTAEGQRATNSILVIDGAGTIVEQYDKAHLVPFGEYVPFSAVLSRIGLGALAAGENQFSAGRVRDVLNLPGLPAARPLICYEAIFYQGRRNPGAKWVLNVTNDAWFGDTPGPYQHLRHVVLRSIEEGLSTVRVANTGISGIVDPYGRFNYEISLNSMDFRDGILHEPVATFFAQFGHALFTCSMALLLAWVVFGAVSARSGLFRAPK